MLSDEWLPKYRLLENFTAKWNGNGNGNAYDRGDYNSSFALCAVELKTKGLISHMFIGYRTADLHLCFRICNQSTNGPVNAHLISWPSKAQNIQNLENIW